jgi:hypothetical protein
MRLSPLLIDAIDTLMPYCRHSAAAIADALIIYYFRRFSFSLPHFSFFFLFRDDTFDDAIDIIVCRLSPDERHFIIFRPTDC